MPELNGPEPMYRQLATIVEGWIDAGDYPPNSKLPSEAELGERYGVSRRTVRDAYAILLDKGRVVASQGKGMYVAE